MKFTLAEPPDSGACTKKFPPASAYIIPEPLLGYWRPTLAAILLMLALLLAATAHAQGDEIRGVGIRDFTFKYESLLASYLKGDTLWVSDSMFVLVQKAASFKERFGWITDSIKWVTTDTMFAGDEGCNHDWVYGEPDFAGQGVMIGCTVIHPVGQHCGMEDDVREKICRNCQRGELEREQWFQHYIPPPKTEFDKLKEKQREKQ